MDNPLIPEYATVGVAVILTARELMLFKPKQPKTKRMKIMLAVALGVVATNVVAVCLVLFWTSSLALLWCLFAALALRTLSINLKPNPLAVLSILGTAVQWGAVGVAMFQAISNAGMILGINAAAAGVTVGLIFGEAVLLSWETLARTKKV